MASSVTMTTVDNILKEVYEGQLNDQLQSEAITAKRIESTSEGVTEDVGGKYVRFPIRTKRNHGIGARNEGEVLPDGLSQGYSSAQLNLSYQYGTVKLNGQVFELAERNFQAFASALQEELDGLKEGLRKDTNRQMYGTGKGTLVTANASGTTTTLVTSNADAIYMEVGMIVDLYDNADALKTTGNAKEITNIQEDTPSAGSTTITFTPAAGGNTASGDYFVRDDNLNKEILGFGKIVNNTGSLYGIDPASVPVWKSEMDTPGSPRNISEGSMISMCDRIRKRGGRTTVIFTTLGVRRAYFQLLTQQRRYNNTQEFEGGFNGLAFTTDWGDIPLVTDFDCPSSTMWFMNEKQLKIYHTGQWSWMNRDGSNWTRVYNVPSGGGNAGFVDAYMATMFRYWQIGTKRRNSHGKMTNINEAS